jgi:hypothetical protein
LSAAQASCKKEYKSLDESPPSTAPEIHSLNTIPTRAQSKTKPAEHTLSSARDILDQDPQALHSQSHPQPSAKMRFSASIITLALASVSQAYLVDLFSDTDCRNPAGQRNVYDNTCAPLGGFSSFRITFNGGGQQMARSYSPNNCGSGETVCTPAVASDRCFRADNSNGGANAMGSSLFDC